MQIFGKIINAGLALLTVKIITNTISQKFYGDYVTLFEFMGIFGIFADFGLFTIAVREMSRNPKNKENIFRNIFGMRIALVLIFFTLAIITGFFIHDKQYLKTGLLIASLTTTFTIFSGTIFSVLQYHLKMGKATIATIISKAISLSLIVHFAKNNQGNETEFLQFLSAGAIGTAIMLILAYTYASKFSSLKPKFDLKFWKKTMKNALPYAIALILTQIYFKIDIQMIYFLRSEEEAGIYGISVRIIEALFLFGIFFMNSTMPMLSSAVKNNRELTKKIIKKSFEFMFFIGTPIVVGIFFISQKIILKIGNEQYLSTEKIFGSEKALNLLIIAMFFSYLAIVFEFLMITLNKQKILLKMSLATVLLNIILNLIFIPKYGVLAAVLTSIISEILSFIMKFYYSKKTFLGKFLDPKTILKYITASSIMGIFLYLTKNSFGIFFTIFFGAIIYISLIIYLGAISKKQITDIFRK